MLQVDGQSSGIIEVVQSNTSVRVFNYGTVNRSNNGTMFQCVDTLYYYGTFMSDVATLDVQCK